MNQKIINVIRIILVLPSALIAHFLMRSLFILTMHYNWLDDEGKVGWQIKYMLPLVSSFFAGCAFIVTGYYVAPYWKNKTVSILLVIVTLIFIVGGFKSYLDNDIKSILMQLGQFIGAFLVFVKIKKTGEIF